MIRLFHILLLALLFGACNKEERYTTRICGTWKLDKLERSTYDQGTLVSTETQRTDFKLSFFDNEGGVNRLFFSGDSLTKTFFDTEIDQNYSGGYAGVISYKMNEESEDRLDFNKIICTVTKLNRRKLQFHMLQVDPSTGNLVGKQEFFMSRD